MISDAAQWIAELIGGGSPSQMGFLKWLFIFVPIMVLLLYLFEDKDE
jgi:hypothetical protein